jgi:mxaJ protein
MIRVNGGILAMEHRLAAARALCQRLVFLAVLPAGVLLHTPAVAAAEQQPAAGKLKVCADPYMLPFSNKDGQGYENRIAELFARELGWQVQYEWFPQRIGFIRQTLRAQGTDGSYKCDLVITVPEHFELAATTEPYYTSTYVLALARGRGFDDITSAEMLGKVVEEEGRQIRMGISDRGQGQLWVFRNGLMGNIVPYMGQPGDPKINPGEQMMRDIASGRIDAAVIWGPSAGYYAKELKPQADIVLLEINDDPRWPDMKFHYSIAMGVRHGDREWLDTINGLLKRHEKEINDILKDFGIPLLPVKKTPRRNDDDDD